MATKATTDHEKIRSWVEERGAWPACVKDTGDENDVGMIRIDFPGYEGKESLQKISWGDWFEKFDENNLAFLYREKTNDGERTNFNKLVARDTARNDESVEWS